MAKDCLVVSWRLKLVEIICIPTLTWNCLKKWLNYWQWDEDLTVFVKSTMRHPFTDKRVYSTSTQLHTITQIIGRSGTTGTSKYRCISASAQTWNLDITSLDTSSHLDLRNPIQLTAVHLWRDLWAKTSPCGWTHRPSRNESCLLSTTSNTMAW